MASGETRGSDPIDVATGARIRQRRSELDWSQTRLAAAVGVTFQQIQKYELGRNRVSVSRLVKIAAALGVPVADLIVEDRSAVGAPAPDRAAVPGLEQLAAAYAGIKDPALRLALLALARELAAKT